MFYSIVSENWSSFVKKWSKEEKVLLVILPELDINSKLKETACGLSSANVEFTDNLEGCLNNFEAKNKAKKNVCRMIFPFDRNKFFSNNTDQKDKFESFDICPLFHSYPEELRKKLLSASWTHCVDYDLFVQRLSNVIASFLRGKKSRLVFDGIGASFFSCGKDEYKLSNVEGVFEGVNFRELLKMIFEKVGIELEFSGKESNERGVIVDYDEMLLEDKNIFSDNIRLGNTAIKIYPGYCFSQQTIILLNHNYSDVEKKLVVDVTSKIFQDRH